MELKGIDWIRLNKLILNVFFENMILKAILKRLVELVFLENSKIFVVDANYQKD